MKSNFQKIFLPHREPNHKTQKMCSEIKRHSKVAHKSSSNKVLDDKNFNYFHLFFSGMAFGDGWRVRLGEEKIWNCFREQKITKTHQQTLFHLEKKVKSRFIKCFLCLHHRDEKSLQLRQKNCFTCFPFKYIRRAGDLPGLENFKVLRFFSVRLFEGPDDRTCRRSAHIFMRPINLPWQPCCSDVLWQVKLILLCLTVIKSATSKARMDFFRHKRCVKSRCKHGWGFSGMNYNWERAVLMCFTLAPSSRIEPASVSSALHKNW